MINSKWPPDIGLEPYYCDKWRVIYRGDCRAIATRLSGVSAVVTDPPYNLSFMGKAWDSTGVSFNPATWEKIRSCCLSGAPMLSFGGTRTQHRIACAIEDAGWEIRDCIMWVYGTGFPKSLDIGKAIDKAAGAQREVVGVKPYTSDKAIQGNSYGKGGYERVQLNITSPTTSEAQLWDGWGTALKPAYEPIILAMSPLDGSFANNALKHGVAGLNIDGCRVGMEEIATHGIRNGTGVSLEWSHYTSPVAYCGNKHIGRFPANFTHDGSEEVLGLFLESGSGSGLIHKAGKGSQPFRVDRGWNQHSMTRDGASAPDDYRDSGSAARFFYCAKVSRSERDSGLSDCVDKLLARSGGAQGAESRGDDEYLQEHISLNRISKVKNNHPTVKPLALMEYLCKLVKMPEYNLILDPFCGSGTTLLACGNLGIRSIGIELDEASCEIAANRCAADVVSRIQKGEY